jgi:hypothetical protein
MSLVYDMFKQADGTYQLPDGVYIGLPEEVYHADTALGSTSIKQLAKNPPKWQYDRLRPRKEVTPEHFIWGRAFHCRILEGKEEFERRYAKPPVPADYPHALNTTDQIKDFLKENGQKLTGNKGELTARARDIDGCPPFFDDILRDWYAEHEGHEDLTDRQMQEIEDAVTIMARDPILSSVMEAGTLISGASELSIFSTDENAIRRKGRIDYALPPAGSRTKSLSIDLKHFTTFREGDNEAAATHKIYGECYDVQGAYYLDQIKFARLLADAGCIYGGDDAAIETVKAFLEAQDMDWVWIFIRRDAGMIPVIISVDTLDPMFNHGRTIVADALDRYRDFVSRFGPNELWSDPPKVPLRLNQSALPSYNRGVLCEQPANR